MKKPKRVSYLDRDDPSKRDSLFRSMADPIRSHIFGFEELYFKCDKCGFESEDLKHEHSDEECKVNYVLSE